MNIDQETLNSITEKVIGLAYRVGNQLDCGFLENCYENGLVHELRKAGLRVEQQVSLKFLYDGVIVGDYLAGLRVESSVIIELKAITNLDALHSAQCINYLAAARLPLCLLIDFAKRVDVKRLAGQSFIF